MKKSTLILILLPLLSLGVLFWYLSNANQTPDKINNTSRHPLEYKDNTLQCPHTDLEHTRRNSRQVSHLKRCNCVCCAVRI